MCDNLDSLELLLERANGKLAFCLHVAPLDNRRVLYGSWLLLTGDERCRRRLCIEERVSDQKLFRLEEVVVVREFLPQFGTLNLLGC